MRCGIVRILISYMVFRKYFLIVVHIRDFELYGGKGSVQVANEG